MTEEEKLALELEEVRKAKEFELAKNKELEEKKYTKADLDKIAKEREAETQLKLEANKAEKERTSKELEELKVKFSLIEKEREDEKIAKMEKDERDKYFREKAKEESKIKEEAKKMAEEAERKRFNDEKNEILKKEIEIARKELAMDANLPLNLRRYVLGDTPEQIKESIEQLKKDFHITDDEIKNKLQNKVQDIFKQGGVEHQNGLGDLKLDLKDFVEMSPTEKLMMMQNEPEKWKQYRTLQKKERGEI